MTHQLAKEDLILKQGHEGTQWNAIFIRHKVFRQRSKIVEPLERPKVPIISNHNQAQSRWSAAWECGMAASGFLVGIWATIYEGESLAPGRALAKISKTTSSMALRSWAAQWMSPTGWHERNSLFLLFFDHHQECFGGILWERPLNKIWIDLNLFRSQIGNFVYWIYRDWMI